MMEKILNIDGPLMGLMNKTGQLIALSVLWLMCCIPLITIPTATTALYYAVCKSIRHDQGSALKEYWRSFRANILRGMAAGIPMAGLTALLAMNLRILNAGEGGNALRWGAVLGIGILVSASIYICPILSRFTMKVTDIWKLSFVMAVRFLPLTVLILAGAALGAAVQFYLLPIPALAIVPGAMCLAVTWPMEKIMRHYMPPKEKNDTSWYYN